MRYHISIFILILAFSGVYAQDATISRHYEIQYGKAPNIESGLLTSISISSLVFDRINLAVEDKISLIQFYYGAQLYATILHEYFGHYNRAREFGITPEH